MKLVKLDGRHAGRAYFQYYASVPLEYPMEKSVTQFYKIREWCWEQWGSGCERDMYHYTYDIQKNNGWSWYYHFPNLRIYFDSEEKTSWFMLKWG